MFKGIIYALAACLIWGLIFVIPQFMQGYNTMEIALGRYLFYGIASLIVFTKAKMQKKCRYPLAIWIKAFYYSLIFCIGYYPCIVLSVRYATPAICALIIGISPIAISFYGNWTKKECSYKSLILPSLLIAIGLLCINAPHLSASETPTLFILGLICGICALCNWSWYVVANARFLKENPTLHSSDWATLNGVATLILVGGFTAILLLFWSDHIDASRYVTLTPALINFFIGSTILGFFCSWVGIFLWNKATLHLSVSLAGQMTIFETLFGLLLAYLFDPHLPPALESIGIAILLIAIVVGIRVSVRSTSVHTT